MGLSQLRGPSIRWTCCPGGDAPGSRPPSPDQEARSLDPGPAFLFWLQFSLMVAFPEVPLGIFLFCVCVIAIGAVQVGRPPGLPRAASAGCGVGWAQGA